MDVGLSTGVSPFCVMRYNASAFFAQSNAEAKNASAHYMRKFWGQSIPPKELTELDVYDAVKSVIAASIVSQCAAFCSDAARGFDSGEMQSCDTFAAERL